MPRLAFASALLAFAASTSAVPALNFTVLPDATTISAEGPVVPGDADKLRRFLRENERLRYGAAVNLTLNLHSPGGSVLGGIELANTVRELGLMTHVRQGASCYSACTFVFLGGVKRTILGNFGIHAMSKGGDGIVTYDDKDLAGIQYLVSTLVNLAQSLVGDSRMITEMLRVPASGIHHVPDEHLAEWRIITQASRPTQRMKASFDCSRSNLPAVERTVCDSLTLAEADRRLAVAYNWLVSQRNEKIDANEIKASQERWRAYRDSCQHVRAPNEDLGLAACVRTAYEVRLKQLEGLMNYHLAAAMPPAASGWQAHEPAADITRRAR